MGETAKLVFDAVLGETSPLGLVFLRQANSDRIFSLALSRLAEMISEPKAGMLVEVTAIGNHITRITPHN